MRKSRAGLVGVLAMVAIGLLAGAVAASHLINRTYTGTISGGGTVRFNVTGTDVDNFTADPDGSGPCLPVSVSNLTLGTAANHPFSGNSTGASRVTVTTGTFPSVGTASGTLGTALAGGGDCGRPPNTSWTASVVAATPTPTATPRRTAAPVLTPVPTRIPTRSLPNSGSPAGVIALSGLSLLEAGWGLRLLSRRFQTPLYMVPSHLLRKLLSARRHGQDEVKLTEDWYLVWRKDEDR